MNIPDNENISVQTTVTITTCINCTCLANQLDSLTVRLEEATVAFETLAAGGTIDACAYAKYFRSFTDE